MITAARRGGGGSSGGGGSFDDEGGEYYDDYEGPGMHAFQKVRMILYLAIFALIVVVTCVNYIRQEINF